MKSFKELRDTMDDGFRNRDNELRKDDNKMLYDDVIKRMVSAYKKRKREKKIAKLKQNPSHWAGLE